MLVVYYILFGQGLQTVAVFHFQAIICMEDKLSHWKMVYHGLSAEVFFLQIRRERLTVF
jgi:hypothetical protein